VLLVERRLGTGTPGAEQVTIFHRDRRHENAGAAAAPAHTGVGIGTDEILAGAAAAPTRAVVP